MHATDNYLPDRLQRAQGEEAWNLDAHRPMNATPPMRCRETFSNDCEK
jgi:hypothetical protein